MKKYAFLTLIGLFISAFALLPLGSMAQEKDSTKTTDVSALVNSRHYIFKAQTATPLSGRLRQLTSEYDLQVSTDKIVAYLPYFGRAYTAPMDPSKGGIQFTSKDFDYAATEKKKGSWSVSIKTKDLQDEQQLQLNIFSNGTASLQVNSNNRQGISFNGYITAPDQKP